jgi:hypothetical protein
MRLRLQHKPFLTTRHKSFERMCILFTMRFGCGCDIGLGNSCGRNCTGLQMSYDERLDIDVAGKCTECAALEALPTPPESDDSDWS